jgi:predicted flap endonuclease-1-like 5' DNA nuclease
MADIKDIEGIGEVYAAKLREIGITTVEKLLEAGSSPDQRAGLVEKTGISSTLILKWVNMADLYRVIGVAEEYSELLEAAGVDTVVELSKRVPENLHAKMVETNEARKLVRKLPSLKQCADWIEQAKTMPRVLTY